MAYFSMIFAVLTIVGGVIGFLKAGSQMSLISSFIAGALLFGFAWAHLKEKVIGYWGLISVSATLLVFFGIRYMNTGAVMPALLMVVLSAVNLIGLIIKPKQISSEQSNNGT